MNEATFSGGEFVGVEVALSDSILEGFLVKRYSNGLLHSFSRRIQSEICMKNECRPFDVVLYWSLTGRYLGFELPESEFFSKTDHVEFEEGEYLKIHRLISDPLSPLKNYSLNELIPLGIDDVDAISSATIADVKDYIVEGAVYSTYMLWHLVHGTTKSEIQKITRSELDENLMLKVISSENINDIAWGLSNFPIEMEMNDELIARLIELTKEHDLTISSLAIGALTNEALVNETVQLKLFSAFDERGYLIKQKILNAFEKVPTLNPLIISRLINNLSVYNGSIVKGVLELISIHHSLSVDDEMVIANLMNHDNRYIAKKAFRFFEIYTPVNEKVNKKMKRYVKRNPSLVDYWAN